MNVILSRLTGAGRHRGKCRFDLREAGCRRRDLGSRPKPGLGRLRSLVTAHAEPRETRITYGNGRVPIFPLHKLRRCVGV